MLTVRLTARIEPHISQGQIYGFEVLVGIGTGCFIQAGYAVIQAVVPPAEMAYAISFMMLGASLSLTFSQPWLVVRMLIATFAIKGQLVGITWGLAISGAIFVNDAVSGLTQVLPDASRADLQRALLGASGAYFRSLPPHARTQATDTIVLSLQKVFIPVYVGAAVSLVCSVLFTVSLPSGTTR